MLFIKKSNSQRVAQEIVWNEGENLCLIIITYNYIQNVWHCGRKCDLMRVTVYQQVFDIYVQQNPFVNFDNHKTTHHLMSR
jgi:hypothetical protein